MAVKDKDVEKGEEISLPALRDTLVESTHSVIISGQEIGYTVT